MNELNDLEFKIAKFLRFGVIFAGVIMATGWLLTMHWKINPFFVFQTYDPIPLQDLLLLHFQNKEWAQLTAYLGLIVLISLPIIRVFLTGIIFFKRSEHLLAVIAALVLLCLIASFALGLEI